MRQKTRHIKIASEVDIARAIFETKAIAKEAGLKETSQFGVATAVSELARNIFKYAKTGEITLQIIEKGKQKGVEVIAEDDGPGIEDLTKAFKGELSTDGSLGLGLAGVKRLMDEFTIDTGKKRGTKIITRKWS